ncbi:polysaccharide biosynthesis/export family protein [Moraxella boevrei]|uniref:polysaccharide biosynthesis/export family protein n=1 Tax=Faucicola boevrei TaxID=346665 RepID=UPI003736BB21
MKIKYKSRLLAIKTLVLACAVLPCSAVFAVDDTVNQALHTAVQTNSINESNQQFEQQSQASQQAINSATLGSQPIVTTTGNYQAVGDNTKMFGAQLFRGAFASTSGANFNSNYVINAGDNIQLRMWGAYQFSATMTVDPQGNIFIPNVGPVHVAGVRNGNLQSVVKSAVGKIYRANVGVYASLQEALPVRVFVTGFVNQPGYYSGVAADSVLSYIDRAGGVDPKRGSYIDIQIRRHGQIAQQVNLYKFLLAGQLEPFSFEDGDVITVAPQRKTFSIDGEVQNAYTFEFDVENLTVSDILEIANPTPQATNISVARGVDRALKSEYYPLADAEKLKVYDGDKFVVTSDRYASTIGVQVRGAHVGNGVVVLPHGATLKDVVAQIRPSETANLTALKIYRKSVAEQQKRNINTALDKLQEMSLATQSITKEEASLRQIDAQMIDKFIAKARQVQPDGMIVVQQTAWQDVLLEQGDVIEVPEKTSVVTVNGEVRFQNAITFNPSMIVGDYIAKSGGYNANADKKNIIVIHPNGENVVVKSDYVVQQGDQIMVLPAVKTKRVEVGRGLSQILYQIAIAAKVVLNL